MNQNKMLAFVSICTTCILTMGQTGSQTSGPQEIIQKLETAGVFEVPEFEFTSEYDGYRTYDHLQGLFFDALPYHGDSTKVFCWYGLPENIPAGSKVPAVVLVHGGGGTVFPDWVKKWTDRGYAAISIALEGQVAGLKDAGNKWPTHPYSGPFRTAFFSDLQTENPEDVWFYHAVADVILANSLIRGFPEIDTTRIGITGISWGGILASVIAGIDERFNFAIPVYGCGYLQDSPLYNRQMGYLSDVARTEYLRSWDPSNYIPLIAAPSLFVNGTNDCHYTLNCFTSSYEALNAEKYLRVEHNMPHGHSPGWNPEAIYQFADYITGSASRPIAFTFEGLANLKRVNYGYEGELISASLFYTTDTSDWDCENYEWIEIPVELDTAAKRVSARIPENTLYYFVNGVSVEGSLYSSSMRKVETDSGFAHYPEFSWDHVPLYMHMRKSTAFNQEELEYLAGFPFVTVEKTTGASTYGSSEAGAIAAAQGIKAINPESKVLYYRNVLVHYPNTYAVDTGLNTISEPFLKDSSGELVLHRDVRPHFDLSNDSVRRWWVDHAVDMSNKEEIDGIFYDAIAKVATSYIEPQIGSGKKQAVQEAFYRMMEECQAEMDPAKINIANVIRASFENYGMDNLHYFDGSYLEGFKGNPSYYAEGIKAAQTAAREGNLICLTLGMDDILPGSDDMREEGGHLVLPDSVQAEFDFYLSLFLVIAEEYSYFLVHDGSNAYSIMGDDRLWLKRFAEYDMPLGPPKGPAVQSGYIYTRQFENAAIYLDLGKSEGRIAWGTDSIPYPPGQDPDPEKYSLTFVLAEANSPSYVSGALIELDTLAYLSNDAGKIYFTLDSGNYSYTVSMPGYFPLDSSIYLRSDSTVYLSLQSSTASVKFRVKEADTPLANADVTLDDEAMQTNQVGLAVFMDIDVNEDYTYSVGKEGYETLSGDFMLMKDTTINVTLNAATGVRSKKENALKIYPLPAEDHIVIESGKEMQEIQLVDLNGRVWLSTNVTGKHARIELPPGYPKICILKVFFNDRTVVRKKVMGI
ncbi:MAG: prolyl oligopeptidase family serine peptidase [Bacteroidetes bacterium]|nr:prolyl oligopeptidase family serine peptidase [Bacteroidota bacterium]